nr:MAG TPA_asm: hypothetical protein [Caudoviricetes sp.]
MQFFVSSICDLRPNSRAASMEFAFCSVKLVTSLICFVVSLDRHYASVRQRENIPCFLKC